MPAVPSTPKLKLLPTREYVGVNDDDPVRFYRWPIFGRMYRRRVELCLGQLTGGQSILEVGFGSGLCFLNLHEMYREICGLDLTADVRAVSQNFAQRGISTRLFNGNILDMPFADASFDAVLLISILEHLKPEDQDRAFTEIRRVLKPGGQCVFGVPVERRLMVFMFKCLGYNIREHHFSTHDDVSAAAGRHLEKVNLLTMRATPGFMGAVYQVGNYRKA